MYQQLLHSVTIMKKLHIVVENESFQKASEIWSEQIS